MEYIRSNMHDIHSFIRYIIMAWKEPLIVDEELKK